MSTAWFPTITVLEETVSVIGSAGTGATSKPMPMGGLGLAVASGADGAMEVMGNAGDSGARAVSLRFVKTRRPVY